MIEHLHIFIRKRTYMLIIYNLSKFMSDLFISGSIELVKINKFIYVCLWLDRFFSGFSHGLNTLF